VKVNGQSLFNWETSHKGVPVTTFNNTWNSPKGEFYVIELQGSFDVPRAPGLSPRFLHTKFFGIITPSGPTGSSFTWNPWFSNRPMSLGSLGLVNHSLMPAFPGVTKDRVPNLLALDSTQAIAVLRGSNYRVSVHYLWNAIMPPLSVVAQSPAPGKRESVGVVTLSVTWS